MYCYPNFSGQNGCVGTNTYQVASGGLRTECVCTPFGYGRCCKNQNANGYYVGNVYFVPQTTNGTWQTTGNCGCGGCGATATNYVGTPCGCNGVQSATYNGGPLGYSGGSQGCCCQNQCVPTCKNALNFMCLCRLFG